MGHQNEIQCSIKVLPPGSGGLLLLPGALGGKGLGTGFWDLDSSVSIFKDIFRR